MRDGALLWARPQLTTEPSRSGVSGTSSTRSSSSSKPRSQPFEVNRDSSGWDSSCFWLFRDIEHQNWPAIGVNEC